MRNQLYVFTYINSKPSQCAFSGCGNWVVDCITSGGTTHLSGRCDTAALPIACRPVADVNAVGWSGCAGHLQAAVL
jgi:hypothetical protein